MCTFRWLADRGRLPAVLLLALLPMLPHSAAADGAVAVGVPADVSKHGYAYGRTVNAESMSTASEHALYNCRSAQGASDAARNLCLVVMTFRNQCASVALDPQAGTPGAGWAVAPTRDAAETQALAECVGVAGPGRRDYCKITDTGCDGD